MLGGLLRRYDTLLTARPVLTKTVTAVAIASCGDAIAQAGAARAPSRALREDVNDVAPFSSSSSRAILGDEVSPSHSAPLIDLRRLSYVAAWVAMTTPAVHRWYIFLVQRFPASPLLRMLADQTFFAPIGTAGFFLFTGSAAAGWSADAGLQSARDKTWPALKANWVLWPTVQYLNFSFTPPRLQVLAVNVVSLFWTAFLSHSVPTVAPEPREGGPRRRGQEGRG
jgi:hypothetical protein